MADLVAVIDSFNAFRPSFLKRTALLFDKMALPQIDDDTIEQWLTIQPNEYNELLWLIERGIVYQVKAPTVSDTSLDDETEIEMKQIARALEKSLRMVLGEDMSLDMSPQDIRALAQQQLGNPDLDYDTRLRFLGNFIRASEHVCRLFGCFLRSKGLRAYPVLPFSIGTTNKHSASDVLEIVLHNLPTPSYETPWEQILEYRADPDARAKFVDLRNWINEVVREKLTPVEIAEKLEYLLSQYERHMNLHKIKTNSGMIETVVVSTAEIAENLVKLKLGTLAKMPFAVRQRKIALLEGELTSPGSEVAYILKTQQAFT